MSELKHAGLAGADNGQLPPDPASLELLRYRFRYAGLGDPLIDTVFEIAAGYLPRAGEVPSSQQVERPDAPSSVPFIPVDPVNLVQMDVKLPPLPTVLMELQTVTNNRNSSAAQVAEVISKDPGLTAWILKLVNSPFFGFSIKIDTVSRAVTLLGMQQLQTLAIGGMLNTLMVRMPPDILNLDDFWRHSVATGIAAQSIWKLMGQPESERLFVAGLLHDCGILALAYTAPKTFKAVEMHLRSSGRPRHLVEQELLDFDHPRLGGMLLHRWNMALPLVMAVLRHHDVEAPQRNPEAAVVHIADILSFALVANGPEETVPPVCPTAWDALGLSRTQLMSAAADMKDKLDEMCKVFTR